MIWRKFNAKKRKKYAICAFIFFVLSRSLLFKSGVREFSFEADFSLFSVDIFPLNFAFLYTCCIQMYGKLFNFRLFFFDAATHTPIKYKSKAQPNSTAICLLLNFWSQPFSSRKVQVQELIFFVII